MSDLPPSTTGNKDVKKLKERMRKIIRQIGIVLDNSHKKSGCEPTDFQTKLELMLQIKRYDIDDVFNHFTDENIADILQNSSNTNSDPNLLILYKENFLTIEKNHIELVKLKDRIYTTQNGDNINMPVQFRQQEAEEATLKFLQESGKNHNKVGMPRSSALPNLRGEEK